MQPATHQEGLPLQGITVLELGQVIAGPFCTRLLADMGASVIKVEPPGKGDPIRSWGKSHNGSTAWWSVHARNKQSLTLNLKHEKSRELVLKLAAQADIIVENNKPGQLEKWGVGPDALEQVNPQGILVRISGYGQAGPKKDRPAFGVIGESMGGLRYLTNHAAGVADHLPPVRVGISIGDSLAAMYGAMGALAALNKRNQAEEKSFQVIDVALSESVLSVMEGCLPEFGLFGAIRQPTGSSLPSCAPTNAYPTADGRFILIAANSDPLFANLSKAMGKPELAQDPRYSTNPERVKRMPELDAMIAAWTRQYTLDELEKLMDEAPVPASRIFTMEDIAQDEQYHYRKMVDEVEDPIHGKVLHYGVMPMFQGIDRRQMIRWAGPSLGQHTDQVLSELGYSVEDIAELRAEGVI
ncbi:CaiB/BaiF CoA transferase family protein [Pelobacter seleniigenes]|uniref:CaiB/BaiF CoA transferase family protein n=1 Tax=Pelobacter seleniigenes TaxID=407188 RepID=UPI0004A6ADBB|nr:CaiB/BaiF CoA-transferase family protein [Pelobacter seleniigenes]